MSEFPKYMLVVDVSVNPEVEDAWNDWYDNIHLPEIAACPGFKRSARYVSNEAPRNYLTVYELDSPEALKSAEFSQRRGWSNFKEHVKAKVRLYENTKQMEGKK
jgi:antibiotic biosynthesis monooxygenase (ABM) superfamily enzyme